MGGGKNFFLIYAKEKGDKKHIREGKKDFSIVIGGRGGGGGGGVLWGGGGGGGGV